jgi:guanylate kinase
LPQIPPGPPILVVLSAPSGAGTDAVRELLMQWQLPAHFVVTTTTRPMRAGEVNGVDYIFVDDAEFDRMLRDDELIEHATVYGRRYGPLRSQFLDPLARGENVIARLDVQGAATLKRLFPDALLIFIAPPSLEEARRRLETRRSDTDEQIRLRSEIAAQEMEAARSFDYTVVNETGKLEETARRVVQIIADEKARRLRR